MIHELKILPEYFNAVISGEKTFEIRKNDRPFKKGDLLALNEYDGHYYTGNSCVVYIDYILNDPKNEFCKSGYVVMSIKPCAVYRIKSPRNETKYCVDYSVPYATREEDYVEREEDTDGC